MAQAAQVAGEATARRFDGSREKGSAASAVACFMRDMMTLRQGMELLQNSSEQSPITFNMPPASNSARPGNKGNSGTLRNNNSGSGLPRNGLIRRPAQIFVDADTDK
jgi:hypothetical protein